MLDGQILINREWVELSGNPNSTAILSEWNQVDWTSSALDGQDNLIVVGNTQEAAGHTDILVSKYERKTGALLWEKTYNGSFSGHDYGVSVLVDNQDNVIVGGVVSTASGQSAIQLLKYSSSGVLTWSSQWTNSSGNLYDVPTGMTFDNSGNIIVAGATLDATLQTDWVILKFNTSGVLQWDETYDYAGYHDFPTTIDVNSANNISVLGFSEDTIASYNFITVSFSNTSGSILSQDVKSLPDVSGTAPASVFVDANHNVYIAATTNDPSNSNLKLIKVSGNDIKWVKEIDTEGLNDIAKSVVVDNNGDVIVAGESDNGYGGKYFFINKYESNGTELFSLAYDGYQYSESKAKKIKINSNNDIFVIAESNRLGTKDVILLAYNTDGALITEKVYDSSGDDIPRDLQVNDNGEVFVTGVAENNGTQYLTVKYKVEDVPLIISNDDNGNPLRRGNTIIVRFDPNVILRDNVNDLSIEIAEAPYFIKKSAIDSIETRTSFTFERVKLIRIFKKLRTTDSTSISTTGRVIRRPDYWSAFEMVLPTGISVDDAILQMTNAFPIVFYSESNGCINFQTTPNDPLFKNSNNPDHSQYALFEAPINYPHRCDINAERAWDFETGKSSIRVGIFDTGIEYLHDDFTAFDPINLEFKYVMHSGWDYVGNVNLQTLDEPDINGHGTAVAGIIGAISNNEFGIAGVAGGQASSTYPAWPENIGATEYGLKISDDENNGFTTYAIQAVEDAVNIYDIDIMNHSWGGYDPASVDLLRETIEYAHSSGVVNVSARGNWTNSLVPTPQEHATYPACFDKEWTLCITGTSTNGRWKDLVTDGGNWSPYIDEETAIERKKFIDFGAPCIKDLVETTLHGEPYNKYGDFEGTSASAPLTSGAAALILSYLNTNDNWHYSNLVHEDVEYILKKSVFPKHDEDDEFQIGGGRLNIGGAIELVDKNKRELIHYGTSPQSTGTHSMNQKLLETRLVKFVHPYKALDGTMFEEETTYEADIYEVTGTFTHSFVGDLLFTWPRHSGANGFGLDPVEDNFVPRWINPHYRNYLESSDNGQAVLKSYFYKISDIDDNYIGWVPFDPEFSVSGWESTISMEYSVLVGEPLVGLNSTPEENGFNYQISPNPTEEKLILKFSNKALVTSIEIFSSTGILLENKDVGNVASGEKISFNLPKNVFPNGLYFVRVVSDRVSRTQPFVIGR